MTALSEWPSDHEPAAIVAWLKTLAGQLAHLDQKNDRRFDQLDEKVDELAEETGERLTDLETDRRIAGALTQRRVRRSDKHRHWIGVGIGVCATLLGGGVAELIHLAVGG